jgi:diaminohydroxyphosphoribosylaminopyrimidine deaminase/5-amino-6-(5-phosphoribosylamino)uracil reductase
MDIMQECAQLALLGKGYTKTNPVVGCVITKNGKIISRGWHEKFGGPHAEVNAINNATEDVKGADLYVTLEPCSHQGKTPPCAEKIVEAGIKRVFIGVIDPNPVNAGKGLEILKNNGIEVYVGYMEDLCASIIEDFTKKVYHNKPYYTVKAAQSLDGKIATGSCDSKWITSKASRAYSHYMRAVSDAVLVGVETVVKDDPELNVRHIKSTNDPYKIVLDPKGRMPLDRKLVTNSADRLIYVTMQDNDNASKLKELGADVIFAGEKDGMLDLDVMSDELIKRDILNVMIEGGGATAGAFFDSGLVDKANFFIAPIIVGGYKTSVGGKGVETIAEAYKLKEIQTKQFEQDLMYSGIVKGYKKPVLDLTEKIRSCCACGCSAHKE